ATEQHRRQAEIARLQKLLDQAQLDAGGLKQRVPLSKFLALVEERLPKEQKVAIRLDRAGLGKDYARVAGAPTSVSLGKVSLRTLLDKALAGAPGGVAYALRPGGIVITRRRL